MTQWRGMGRPGPRPERIKQYGVVGPIQMPVYDAPGFDMDDLRNRGWTPKLIEKYLGDEDRRDPVLHWANFSGKKVYLVARVELAEAIPEFEVDFTLSARRRRLQNDFVEATIGRCRELRERNTKETTQCDGIRS